MVKGTVFYTGLLNLWSHMNAPEPSVLFSRCFEFLTKNPSVFFCDSYTKSNASLRYCHKNNIYVKFIFLNLIFAFISPLVYGNSCVLDSTENIKITESHRAQLNIVQSQIENRLRTLPVANVFISLDHKKIVQDVVSLMPKVLATMNHEKLPEVVFVQSLEEFYKLRFKNISNQISNFTGYDPTIDALNTSIDEFAFYDPYANKVVVNLYSFSTSLNLFTHHREPTLKQYTAALKIFLSHEFTHGFQENNFQLVSKMISGGPHVAQLSVLIEGHAIYVEELFAKLIGAEGFLLNMHQQVYDFTGSKNSKLREILNLKMAFESNHDTNRDGFWGNFLVDFEGIISPNTNQEFSILKLTEFGSAEEEIVRSIWSEGRRDEFTRPLKIFNLHLTPEGEGAEDYRQIIAEVKKLKEGHLDTNIRFIYQAKEVVGFFRIVEVDGNIELDQLYVRKKMRGKGVGTMVMNYLNTMFGHMAIELYVLENNPAVKFYGRFGFEIVESLKITSGYEHVPQLPVYKMVRPPDQDPLFINM